MKLVKQFQLKLLMVIFYNIFKKYFDGVNHKQVFNFKYFYGYKTV